jgi:hypothetical protein
MASQVFSGSGNFSYTNNTGQNVRVIINYCSNQQGSGLARIAMSWASVSISIQAIAFGRNLAFSAGNSSNGYAANNMYTGSGTSAPTEIMLSNGQSFSLSSSSTSYPNEAYNVVVIPEAG